VLKLLLPAMLLGGGVVGVAALVLSGLRPSETSDSPFAPVAARGDEGFDNEAAPDTAGTAFTVRIPATPATSASGDGGTGGITVPAQVVTLGAADGRAATRVQNFSCDTASSIARQLVCTHWELATVDYNLSLAYRRALGAAPNPDALRREQRNWLQSLDKQRDPGGVLHHYQRRLQRLAGIKA